MSKWKPLPRVNSCECGCGEKVAQRFAVGHSRRRPLLDRFMEKVEKTETCWLWTGAVSTSGYGRIGIDGNRLGQAHRIAYELLVGEIPAGLHVDHLCCQKLCVRPNHLEPVTQAENNRRAALNNRASHCQRGHEFTTANTVISSRGTRQCRECKNARARDLRAKARLARQAAA